MANQSTVSATNGKAAKPNKPRPDFPLFPHATRRWAKKIRGKLHYFGPWNDPDGALEKYLDQKDDLYAGRKPRSERGGLTVRDLCNHFLTDRRHRLNAGEIVLRTWQDYHQVCERLIKSFGRDRLVEDLAPDDFVTLRDELAKTRGPVALGNEVQRVRVVFNYGFQADLFDRPVKFGPTFKRPSKTTLRKARHEKGPRMFEADQIHRLLETASVQLRAMILLAVNCGYGNSDVSQLKTQSVDLAEGWIHYARPKTGVDRRCPIWPETVEALERVMGHRPAATDNEHDGYVFITRYGKPWSKSIADSPVTKEFRKLLDKLNLYRPGLGFYALRHTFETIAGGCRDQVAVDYILGHARDDMASVYRERIDDERLVAVTDFVHSWLFGA